MRSDDGTGIGPYLSYAAALLVAGVFRVYAPIVLRKGYHRLAGVFKK